MQTQSTVPTEAERLTPDEVEAIRRRYADSEGRLPDLQAHGAATLVDVAEAVGLPATEVGRQLDRIRAERAIQPATPVRKDQRGLLAFALVLLAAAYPIHLLNPRKLTDEEEVARMQQRLAEIDARRKAHPVVHYPIATKVQTGPLPPSGFNIEFKGELTDTTTAAMAKQGPQDVKTLRPALVAAALNAYRVAVEAERRAPKPSHPLPVKTNPWGMNATPGPNRLVYAVGTSNILPMSPLPIEPEPGYSPAQWDDEVQRRIGTMVDGLLDGMSRSQTASLALRPPQFGNIVMPPEGFGITYTARQSISTGSSRFVVLPYDVDAVAKKLEWVVRQMMWRDDDPPTFSTPEMRAAAAKKPAPAFAKVTLSGPRGDVVFELPLTASSKYPNAAAAAKAAESILAKAVRRAAEQVASPGPAGSGTAGGAGASGTPKTGPGVVPPVVLGGSSSGSIQLKVNGGTVRP